MHEARGLGCGEEGAGPGVTQGLGETEALAGREHEKGRGGGRETQAQAKARHALRHAKQLQLRLSEAEAKTSETSEAREQLGTRPGQTEDIIAGLGHRGGDR